MDEMGTQKPDIERAREWLAEAILRTPPERLAVEFDSAALTEEFTLLEMTNIPLVGPRIHLAPFANPSIPSRWSALSVPAGRSASNSRDG
jgi:hypothetical protein